MRPVHFDKSEPSWAQYGSLSNPTIPQSMNDLGAFLLEFDLLRAAE